MATNPKLRVGSVQEMSLRTFVWCHAKSGITFWWDPDAEAWCWGKEGRTDGWAIDLAHMAPEIRRTLLESRVLS